MFKTPALEHDAMMLKRFGQSVSPQGKLERRIVANLIAHIEKAGFKVHSVYDGDEEIRVKDMKSAMELIFNLDEVSLRFYKTKPSEWHGVLLVLGNGVDIVSDWNFFDGDRDGFDAAMQAFDSEQYA